MKENDRLPNEHSRDSSPEVPSATSWPMRSRTVDRYILEQLVAVVRDFAPSPPAPDCTDPQCACARQRRGLERLAELEAMLAMADPLKEHPGVLEVPTLEGPELSDDEVRERCRAIVSAIRPDPHALTAPPGGSPHPDSAEGLARVLPITIAAARQLLESGYSPAHIRAGVSQACAGLPFPYLPR